MSVTKLRNILDTDTLLRKAVLINNTLNGLRMRKNTETENQSTELVEDILSKTTAPPPLIGNIEDLEDISDAGETIGDAIVPRDTELSQNDESVDESVVPSGDNEETLKVRNYRMQMNPKRNGRRNQNTLLTLWG